MGAFISRIRSIFNRIEHARILMLGLDNAGKTTVLYKLAFNEVVSSIPTIGFNVESIQYRNVEFNVWDVGGQHKIRPLWRHYFRGTDALIYVVDSNDEERIEESREELEHLLGSDELRDCILLILANKADLPNAMSASSIAEKLGLQSLRNRHWYIQQSCAASGEGLYEGLDWMVTSLNDRRRK